MNVGEFRDLCAKFREVLLTASEHRHLRLNVVEVEGARELRWVVYEREQMLAAVNTEREARDLPPIEMAAVMEAERAAAGHSDYADKFAMGCARLALGGEPDE